MVTRISLNSRYTINTYRLEFSWKRNLILQFDPPWNDDDFGKVFYYGVVHGVKLRDVIYERPLFQ